MYSDDEECGFGGGGCRHSVSPDRNRGSERPRGRSPRNELDRFDDRRTGGGKDRGGKGKSSGGDKGSRSRTTGREIPKINSIHKGTIVRVEQYGAFVRLGDGSTYKDGLLHISRLSATGRVDQVKDIVDENDIVWVKVTEVKEDEGKFSLDMRFVGQKDGEDKDPNNTQVETGGKGKGKGGPEPIRIGAVQATKCSRCGAQGHMARECWAGTGKQYGLLEELPEEQEPERDRERRPATEASGAERPALSVPGHDPKVVKAALKAYLKRKAPGAESSSSSSSSSSEKKKKKKKEKKKQKKEKKKEKKEKKKQKKKQKKEAKAAAMATQARKAPAKSDSSSS